MIIILKKTTFKLAILFILVYANITFSQKQSISLDGKVTTIVEGANNNICLATTNHLYIIEDNKIIWQRNNISSYNGLIMRDQNYIYWLLSNNNGILKMNVNDISDTTFFLIKKPLIFFDGLNDKHLFAFSRGGGVDTLYAINKFNGKIEWSYYYYGYRVQSVVTDSAITIGGSTGELFYLDDNGNVLWTVNPGCYVHGQIFFNNKIAFTNSCGNYFLFDLNGKQLLKTNLGYGWVHVPVVENNDAYVPDWDGYAIKFNIYSGKIEWETNIGYGSNIPMLIGKNYVYFSAFNKKIYQINKNSGQIVKIYNANSDVSYSSPFILGENKLYVGGNDSLFIFTVDDTISNCEWPTLYHDNWRTGNPMTPIIISTTTGNPASLKPLSVDPNPYHKEARRDAVIYRYYRLLDADGNVVIPNSLVLTVAYNGNTYETSTKIYGTGVIQVGINLDNMNLPTDVESEIYINPDIIFNGKKLTLQEISDNPIRITARSAYFTEAWDIFESKSAGVSGSVFSVGAGPSVGIARASISGEGALGLKIEKDSKNNELLIRRFDISYECDLEAPFFKTGIGKTELGANIGLMGKGIAGQTIFVPNDAKENDPNIVKKIKAAYLLEAMVLSGSIDSPAAYILLSALLSSLPNEINQYHQTDFWGIGLEGGAKIGANASIGDKNTFKISFIEVADRIAVLLYYEKYLNNPNKYAIKMDYEGDVNFNIFSSGFGKEKAFGVDFPSLFYYNGGMSIQQEAIYENDVFSEFTIDLISGNEINNLYNYNSSFIKNRLFFPKETTISLSNRKDYATLLNVYELRSKNSGLLPVGNNYLSNEIAKTLDVKMENDPLYPVYFTKYVEKGSGFDLDFDVDLHVAEGAGAGLLFGVNYKNYFTYSYMTDKILFLDNIYKMEEAQPVPPPSENTLSTQLSDLFNGVVSIIADQISSVLYSIENAIDAGKDFVVDITNQAGEYIAEIKGNLEENGTLKILTFLPFVDQPTIEPFNIPKMKRVMFAHKVGIKNGENNFVLPDTSYAIILSDIVNVNFFPTEQDSPVVHFSRPLTLSLTLNDTALIHYGFDDSYKKYVKIFHFDDSTQTWVMLNNDQNEDINIVATNINDAGNYALGLLLDKSFDVTPPSIEVIEPEEDTKLSSYPVFKVKIIDENFSSGLDLSKTKFIIDDSVEADFIWYPDKYIFDVQSHDSIADGQHILKVMAVDNNDNSDSLHFIFNVDHILKINNAKTIPNNFKLFQNYPNPFNSSTVISYYIPFSGFVEISLYDVSGRFVRILYKGQQFAGQHEIRWDGRDQMNQQLASGIYFYKVKFKNQELIGKMILVK